MVIIAAIEFLFIRCCKTDFERPDSGARFKGSDWKFALSPRVIGRRFMVFPQFSHSGMTDEIPDE